jgi:hypothetical protein
MNQLRYKVNQRAPFDVLFTPEQIMGDKKSVAYFTDRIAGFDQKTNITISMTPSGLSLRVMIHVT